MGKIGSGFGRNSGDIEKILRKKTLEDFAERAKVLGRFPGTHTLGKEFETPKQEK